MIPSSPALNPTTRPQITTTTHISQLLYSNAPTKPQVSNGSSKVGDASLTILLTLYTIAPITWTPTTTPHSTAQSSNRQAPTPSGFPPQQLAAWPQVYSSPPHSRLQQQAQHCRTSNKEPRNFGTQRMSPWLSSSARIHLVLLLSSLPYGKYLGVLRHRWCLGLLSPLLLRRCRLLWSWQKFSFLLLVRREFPM